MKNKKPASTVDAPFLTSDEAKSMPELAEGAQAKHDGKKMLDNPYSIENVSIAEKRLLSSSEWRLQFENRFQAWMFGFNSDSGE